MKIDIIFSLSSEAKKRQMSLFGLNLITRTFVLVGNGQPEQLLIFQKQFALNAGLTGITIGLPDEIPCHSPDKKSCYSMI